MACLFELAADCGDSRENALRFGKLFDGLSRRLSDGTPIRCMFQMSDIWQSDDRHWWCRVVPDGASLTGAVAPVVTKPELLAEVARFLYEQLKQSTDFRFARVGWEIEASLDANDWLEARNSVSILPIGVVLNRELWMEIGSPASFHTFGTDYFWKPLEDSDYLSLALWL